MTLQEIKLAARSLDWSEKLALVQDILASLQPPNPPSEEVFDLAPPSQTMVEQKSQPAPLTLSVLQPETPRHLAGPNLPIGNQAPPSLIELNAEVGQAFQELRTALKKKLDG